VYQIVVDGRSRLIADNRFILVTDCRAGHGHAGLGELDRLVSEKVRRVQTNVLHGVRRRVHDTSMAVVVTMADRHGLSCRRQRVVLGRTGMR